MAKWYLQAADPGEVVLRYVDRKNKIDFECGRTKVTTSLKDLFQDYLLNHADTFDVIDLGEGRNYALLPGHKVLV